MALVSFSKTPQAVDDIYSYLEDQLGLLTSGSLVTLDVMADDLGGKAKTLFSIDDGFGNPLNPADLLYADGLVNGVSAWETTLGGNLVRINNGKLELDLSHDLATIGGTNINSLAAGDHIHDSFVYAIRLGNGTLSWAHVTFDVYGENDAATISGDTSGALSENDTTPVIGTLTVIDPDHDQSHTQAITDGASLAGLGTYSVDQDGNWSYTVNNAAVQYLSAGQAATDTFIVTSLDGTAQQTVTVTINGVGSPGPVIPLASLDGSNGFRIDGVATNDQSGIWAASAGDVNGDGFNDLIIGAATLDDFSTSTSYVVFGKASGFTSPFELSSLDGTNGFILSNAPEAARGGVSVASAGDVNGDGFADVIVGALGADPNGEASGASYVVFGHADGFPADFDLLTLDGTNGFKLNGVGALDQSGVSVKSAGDVNGDGYDDIIIGADRASFAGTTDTGAAYVVFGQAVGFAASFELSSLDGSNGFRFSDVTAGYLVGSSVASAGDINGDGFSDVIIGAHGSEASYVVFGHADGFAANLDLSSLDGSNGFKLSGSGFFGITVDSAGDFNGDGFDDLIIGARATDPSGASYVVFGHADGFAANLDISSLDGSNGFKLSGVAAGDLSGISVAGAGDFNGDGFDNLIVGAAFADPNGADSGASYVVFGHADGFAANLDLSSLDGSNGFTLDGVAEGDLSGHHVAGAGDVNGDGFDDLIVSTWAADPNGTDSGASYVIFGGAHGGLSAPVTTTGTAGDEILIGGLGNDTLTGGGGADVFHGGAGDDRLVVGDFTFARIDGGNGVDSFVFAGTDQTLDLTTILPTRMESIERFDLTGSGNNGLIIGADDVLDFSGGGDNGFSAAISNKTFVIDGDAGDSVTLGAGVLPSGNWTQVGDNLGLDGSVAGNYDIFDFVRDGVVIATVAFDIDLFLTIL